MMSEDTTPKVTNVPIETPPEKVETPPKETEAKQADPFADDEGRVAGEKGFVVAQVTRRIRAQIKAAREEIEVLRKQLAVVSKKDQESRPSLDPRLASRASLALSRKIQLKEQEKKTQLQSKLREMGLIDKN